MGKRAYGTTNDNEVLKVIQDVETDESVETDVSEPESIDEFFEEEEDDDLSDDIMTSEEKLKDEPRPKSSKRKLNTKTKSVLCIGIALVALTIGVVLYLGCSGKLKADRKTELDIIKVFCNSVNSQDMNMLFNCYDEDYLNLADNRKTVEEFGKALMSTDSLELDVTKLETVVEGTIPVDEFKTKYGVETTSAKAIVMSVEGYQAQESLVYRFKENIRFVVADVDGSYKLFSVEPIQETFEFIEDDTE